MNFYKKLIFSAVAGISLMTTFVACEDELETIGNGVISGQPFSTNKAVFNVYAYNKKVEAVQTNKFPIYQLGTFNDPIYGKTNAFVNTQVRLAGGVGNPTFGLYTQTIEDEADTDESITTIPENETVTQVLLYIPYLVKDASIRDADGDGVDDEFDVDSTDSSSDSDGDGLTDIQESSLGSDPLNSDTDGDGILDDEDIDMVANAFPKQYDLDSIYGNRLEPFNLKVERSTYFLRNLDPESNFVNSQAYYSNQEFSPTFVSDVLYDGTVIISNEETLIFKEDDPDTEDVDESKEVETRLLPGVMANLDVAFFQENILDKENESELLSQTNFQDFIRGVYLSASGNSEDMLLLLDFNNAKIRVTYEYDKVNTNNTVSDTSDDTVEKAESTYILDINASVSNAVNVLINDTYPPEILNKMDTGENADKIFLKGGAGAFAEIKLFDEVNGRTAINQIKANNWIVNEANLVFYVDRNSLDAAGGTIEPPRLYLYNSETKAPLYYVQYDPSDDESALGVLPNHGGVLEKSAGKGVKYKIRITEYLNTLVVRDSTNATLGLSLTSDIRFASTTGAMLTDDDEATLPLYTLINPLGTILHGSNVSPENEDKKVKLEVYYTEAN